MAIRRVWVGTMGPFLYDDEEHDYAIRTDGELPGGATELGELTNVVLTDPQPGQALVFDGTNWVNQDVALTFTPDPPENVSVETTSDSAEVSWDAVTEVNGYNVYLRSNGEFVLQNSSLITGTSYEIEDLESGSYEVYVTSMRAGFESDPSDIVEFDISDAPWSAEVISFVNNEYIESEWAQDVLSIVSNEHIESKWSTEISEITVEDDI